MNKKAKLSIYLLMFVTIAITIISLSVVEAAKPVGKGVAACKDGIDNDGDGYTDLNDPGCSSKNDKSELDPNVACDDGNDNDGDGYTDTLDPGCYSVTDTSELNPSIECDDGSDNDLDGNTDLSDSGCVNLTDNDETDCGDSVCEGPENSGNCPSDCGQPDSCSDSDGGIVTDVFGFTSGYYNQIFYTSNDSCVDSSNILEYYCNGSIEASQQISCGTDSYGSEYCIGDNVYKNLTDYFCSLGSCDFTITPEFVENCTYGCSSGDCNQIPDSCSDSDGGIVTDVFGITSGYFNQIFYTSNDSCVDSSNILEYYCNGNIEASQQISCGTDSYGSEYCSNDDVYKDLTDYYCSLGECDSSIMPELVEDCGTDSYGSEYCIGDDVFKNWIDNFCITGTCDNNMTPEFVENCGTDSYGSEYCIGDNVYKNLTDYYCNLGSCDFTITPEFVENCTYGCSSGDCDSMPDTCNETDLGYDLETFGITYGDQLGQYVVQNDTCVSGTELTEFYCAGTTIYNTTVDCSWYNLTSCSYGACI